ncbi:MAG: ABC transporter ATP-binding protein [Desulfotomaculales bacterium]
MLEIRNLWVSYGGLPVLRDVSLSLARGESLAVVGESGAGKTTLGLSILGLVEGECRGEILWRGKNLLALSEEELRRLRGREIAMVFQNVETALHPLYAVCDQVAEAMVVHGLGKGEAADRALALLERVGLGPDRARAYPHQLSGGEKQRALLALALANDPEVLVLDEPTASLDPRTKGEIIALLREMVKERITLVITHDLAAAARLAGQMAVLYAGRLVEAGPAADLMRDPRHPYTRGLLRAYPHLATTKDLQGIPGRMEHGVEGCPFHPRCTQRLEVCAVRVPAPAEAGGRMLACHRGGIVPLLEVRGIAKSFGPFRVLRGVNLTLYEGETLALVGESGSGKTTLARIVMGLTAADEGEILLEGQKVEKRTPDFYARVQMVFQQPGESLSHRLNVLQAVKEPLDVQQRGTEEERLSVVKRVLAEVELPSDEGFLKKYPHQLSGGEVQRVAIARALVLDPKLLIADEPTAALDASVQAKILKLLLDLQEKRGLAILFITHDLAVARKVSDRVAVMLEGCIVEEGPTWEVMANPEHPLTRSLLTWAGPQPERSPRGSGPGSVPAAGGSGPPPRPRRAATPLPRR